MPFDYGTIPDNPLLAQGLAVPQAFMPEPQVQQPVQFAPQPAQQPLPSQQPGAMVYSTPENTMQQQAYQGMPPQADPTGINPQMTVQLQQQDFRNPYLDQLKSPLMNDENMAKLQPLYDKYVQQLTNGGSKADKYEDVANRIFAGLVAPAMAVFGSGGMKLAGAQLMQQAQQTVKESKGRRQSEQQYDLAAIKSLIDISKAGSAPAIAAIKDYRAQQGQELRAQAAAAKAEKDNRKMTLDEKKAANLESYRTSLLGLKARGYNISEAKMNQTLDIAKMNDSRIREIAAINQHIQLRGQDNQLMMKKAELQKSWVQDQMKIEQFNAGIAQDLQQKDAKGNYKYSGPDGKPIDPATLQLQMDGGPPQLQAPSEDHIMGAMEEMRNFKQPQQQQVAPVQQQQQMQPQQFGGVFQQIIKSGKKPQEAAALFLESASRHGMPLQQAMEQLKGMGFSGQ